MKTGQSGSASTRLRRRPATCCPAPSAIWKGSGGSPSGWAPARSPACAWGWRARRRASRWRRTTCRDFRPRKVDAMKKYKVAIAGATGVVGREMMKVLEERDFPVAELVPLASERSEGQHLEFRGDELVVRRLKPD